MELVESIYKLYQDTGEKILSFLPDKLKIICEKYANPQSDSFSVSLEIVVLTRIQEEDDYGLVFSTNAQKKSHYGTTGDLFTERLYLVTDLSASDGIIIAEVDELSYLPYNNENIEQIRGIVNDFTLSRIDAIESILLDRYPELADK